MDIWKLYAEHKRAGIARTMRNWIDGYTTQHVKPDPDLTAFDQDTADEERALDEAHLRMRNPTQHKKEEGQ